MLKLKILIILTVLSTIFSCNLSQKLQKSDWTVAEVKDWSNANKSNSTWQGLILYQGSDTVSHHFIGRIMDEWTWFNIKRTEVNLNDLRPFNNTSTGVFGYYYVDPNNEFIKVKDY